MMMTATQPALIDGDDDDDSSRRRRQFPEKHSQMF